MSEREEYSGDLSAYLDGELSESRRRRLDEVLQYDRELAGELDRLRATRELIHSLPMEQPPRSFSARIVARAERSRLFASRRQPRSYRWITLAAAAVVLVAAGLSVVIMQQLSREQQPDTIDPVGHVALVVEDPDNGDVAKAYDKKGAGDADDFVIYTSNLAFAQRDVEKVLVDYGIHPVRDTSTEGAVGNKDIRSHMGRKAFYNPIQTTVNQVQFVVFVPPQQAVKLKNELNVIREQQEVSQAATPPPVVGGAIAPKVAKVARDRNGNGAAAATAEEEVAGRKTQSKAKYVAKAKLADDGLDKKIAVGGDAERIDLKAIVKSEPSSKTLDKKPAERPMPTTKPVPPGTAIAGQTGEVSPPAPVVTRPARGTLAVRKIQEVTAEPERRADKRPVFRQRPGKPSDSQKTPTAPETAPARGPKRLPSTQNALAIRQAVTSQRAEQVELQNRANVTRLLITLNFRGVQPPRSTAEALRKAASQKAAPAAKNNADAAH